jgi:hypothetical protein
MCPTAIGQYYLEWGKPIGRDWNQTPGLQDVRQVDYIVSLLLGAFDAVFKTGLVYENSTSAFAPISRPQD